jgi:hypothetical protein
VAKAQQFGMKLQLEIPPIERAELRHKRFPSPRGAKATSIPSYEGKIGQTNQA